MHSTHGINPVEPSHGFIPCIHPMHSIHGINSVEPSHGFNPEQERRVSSNTHGSSTLPVPLPSCHCLWDNTFHSWRPLAPCPAVTACRTTCSTRNAPCPPAQLSPPVRQHAPLAQPPAPLPNCHRVLDNTFHSWRPLPPCPAVTAC
eukprot:364916-Chlamydomonas_euryale.AAC.7